MAEIFEVKTRIESLNKIKDITYAMQIITITRLKKLIVQANHVKDSLQEIKNIFNLIAEKNQFNNHNFLLSAPKANQKPYLVLFFANRGFCGNFNQDVLNKAFSFCKENNLDFNACQKLFVGKKAESIIKKKFDSSTIELFAPEKDCFSTIELTNLFNLLISKIKQKQPIYFISANFKSIISHSFTAQKFFPFDWNNLKPQKCEEHKISSKPLYFTEPNIDELVSQLIENCFYINLYQVIMDSSCSEFSQRFMIMKNANESIITLQDDLFMELNKQRQNNITQELSEIISTFKALKIK